VKFGRSCELDCHETGTSADRLLRMVSALRSLIGIERFTILPLAIEQDADPRPRIDRIGGRDVPSLPTAPDTDLYRTGHGYAIVL